LAIQADVVTGSMVQWAWLAKLVANQCCHALST